MIGFVFLFCLLFRWGIPHRVLLVVGDAGAVCIQWFPLCSIVLPFYYYFFKLIVFEVSSSQASRLNSFFLLVSALLRLIQWFVWASYRVRFVLSFCFFSDGHGWVRWYACLLMTGFVFLFCLLFRWGILHRVLLVWVILHLVFKWLPLWVFSLLDTP